MQYIYSLASASPASNDIMNYWYVEIDRKCTRAPVVCSPTMIQYCRRPSLCSAYILHPQRCGIVLSFPVSKLSNSLDSDVILRSLDTPWTIRLLERPAGVRENLLLLLLSWICFHRAVLLCVLALLARQLLALLRSWPPDRPVDLAEDVGLDGCNTCQRILGPCSIAEPTINAVRTQDVCALCPPTCRAPVQ